MVEKKGGQIIKQDLLSMKNNDGEIPVLLAAAKGHKEMTSYLFAKTKLEDLTDDNCHNGVLLLTRCINAEIFCTCGVIYLFKLKNKTYEHCFTYGFYFSSYKKNSFLN
jgi:hypothetical protein